MRNRTFGVVCFAFMVTLLAWSALGVEKFELDYAMQYTELNVSASGTNTICLPWDQTLEKASDLIAAIEDQGLGAAGKGVVSIQRFLPESDTYETYTGTSPDTAADDWDLVAGEGYRIKIEGDIDGATYSDNVFKYRITGNHDADTVTLQAQLTNVSLSGNNFYCLPYLAVPRTASDLYDDIGSSNVTSISKFVRSTDGLQTYTGVSVANDFVLEPAKSYLIQMGTTVSNFEPDLHWVDGAPSSTEVPRVKIVEHRPGCGAILDGGQVALRGVDGTAFQLAWHGGDPHDNLVFLTRNDQGQNLPTSCDPDDCAGNCKTSTCPGGVNTAEGCDLIDNCAECGCEIEDYGLRGECSGSSTERCYHDDDCDGSETCDAIEYFVLGDNDNENPACNNVGCSTTGGGDGECAANPGPDDCDNDTGQTPDVCLTEGLPFCDEFDNEDGWIVKIHAISTDDEVTWDEIGGLILTPETTANCCTFDSMGNEPTICKTVGEAF